MLGSIWNILTRSYIILSPLENPGHLYIIISIFRSRLNSNRPTRPLQAPHRRREPELCNDPGRMFWCVDFVLCVTFSTLRMRACVPGWKPWCTPLYSCSFTSKACLSAYWSRFMCEVETLQMYSFSAHPWMCTHEYVMEKTTSDCLEKMCARMCVCVFETWGCVTSLYARPLWLTTSPRSAL